MPPASNHSESVATAVDEIHRLKYRYLRGLDCRDWELFASTLTPDATGYYGEKLRFASRDEIVQFMRKAMPPSVITEHQVHHPEIDVDGDTATGIWYLQDKVIMPERRMYLHGAAFYQDSYRRVDGQWLICATGYQRTFEATVSLDDMPTFALTPGPAIMHGPATHG